MVSLGGGPVTRSLRAVRQDIRADPYLGVILLGATVLCGFWFWHRIPSFATRDERDRLLDPLVAYGRVIGDPSLDALREGVQWGRQPFGATFYLFGLAALPAVVAAALLGDLGAFADLGAPSWRFGYYEGWQALPEYVWTISLVAVRLASVAFAVGSVYLTYRLGTAVRDRATGRLSAVLLTLTFGFLTIAHEGGEDMPALFSFLAALYCLVCYVQSGSRRRFYLASLAGGLAIAFKLTAAPIVPLVAVAVLLRAKRTDGGQLSGLWQPKLLVGGAAIGAVTIVLGFPTALVAGPDPLIHRFVDESVRRTNILSGPDAPVWWWFLRGYFSGLSLPLFVAALLSTLASGWALLRGRTDSDGLALVWIGLGAIVLLYAGWHDFRVHHLLPTFPLLAVLTAWTLERLRASRPGIARAAMAVLLLTTGSYAVAGDLGYASMPRDEATAWLEDNAEEGDVMEVYRSDFQDAAVPYEMAIRHDFGGSDDCPEYIQLTYRDVLLFKDSERFDGDRAQEAYVGPLLEGKYEYESVATFGPEPEQIPPHRPEPGSFVEILPLGLIPQTDQYSDEQELAVNQYTAIFERTGECGPRPEPPF